MTIDPDTLAKSVARLEGVDPVDTGLDAALELAVSETDDLFAVDGAGLMLLSGDGVLRYMAASDEPGRMLETLQEQFGEGPCVDAIRAYTRVIALLLRGAVRAHVSGKAATQLQHALDHRSLIEQAKGVMERRGLDQQAAFDLLRTQARSTRRRLTTSPGRSSAARQIRWKGPRR
jgi:hypothetical protein